MAGGGPRPSVGGHFLCGLLDHFLGRLGSLVGGLGGAARRGCSLLRRVGGLLGVGLDVVAPECSHCRAGYGEKGEQDEHFLHDDDVSLGWTGVVPDWANVPFLPDRHNYRLRPFTRKKPEARVPGSK